MAYTISYTGDNTAVLTSDYIIVLTIVNTFVNAVINTVVITDVMATVMTTVLVVFFVGGDVFDCGIVGR